MVATVGHSLETLHDATPGKNMDGNIKTGCLQKHSTSALHIVDRASIPESPLHC